MSRFKASPFQLAGLLVIEGPFFPDPRGFFLEGYRESDLTAAGLPRLVQDNISRSARGALRGLHYQMKDAAQGKLIRCLRGRIYDVAVDIRKGSPSYGRWAGLEMSDEGNRMLWIPPGFAHGFQVLSEEADVLYKVSSYFSQPHDRGVLWSDPAIGISWPVAETLVSPRDAKHPTLERAENDFFWA